jgi:hypothetical protein
MSDMNIDDSTKIITAAVAVVGLAFGGVFLG